MSDRDDPKGVVATLIASYSDLTRRLSRRMANPADAQDVMQDAWLKLARSAEPAEIRNPEAYVRLVAGNLAIDRIRAHKVRERYFDAEPDEGIAADAPSAERVVDYRQRLQRLRAIIDTLPARQREVFLMHKFDGLSHSEIATRLGISRSAVEKLVMKALASCRDGLGDLLDED